MRGKVSVSQLNAYIKGVFDDELTLHNVEVYGEVFEYSVKNNVTYVTLRDESSYLHCVRYAATEKLDLGIKVSMFGSVSFYGKSGRVSFIFKSVKPYGVGEKYTDFLKLKETLASDGLFSDRKLPPIYIRRVVVVTSETGAVIHDFESVLKAAECRCEISVYPVKVQGEGADEQIAAAVEKINSDHSYDAIVIARGGGSGSDLLSYNTERVARSVAASNIPVISAVGHETDYTLCDFCAGVRAGTPSIAAEYIVRRNESYINRTYTILMQMHSALYRMLRQKRNRLISATYSVVNKADIALERAYAAVGNASEVGYSIMTSRLKSSESELRGLCGRMGDKLTGVADRRAEDLRRISAINEKLNPLKVLANGFSKVYVKEKTLTGIGQVAVGDELKVVLKDGNVGAKVVFKEYKEVKK